MEEILTIETTSKTVSKAKKKIVEQALNRIKFESDLEVNQHNTFTDHANHNNFDSYSSHVNAPVFQNF